MRRPTRSPSRANTVLTELVSDSVKLTPPKLSPPKLVSGDPLMVCGELPSKVDSGVALPVSSAAAAVTTLKVDPGG